MDNEVTILNIVATSNFDEENFNEYVVASFDHRYIEPKMIDSICDFMNANERQHSPVFYKVKPFNYKLYKYDPNI